MRCETVLEPFFLGKPAFRRTCLVLVAYEVLKNLLLSGFFLAEAVYLWQDQPFLKNPTLKSWRN
jgi:hypothetical protein